MKVENSIHIEAPIETVWRVTTDIERWPEWTPTVTAAKRLDSGAFAMGSRAELKQPMQPLAVWTVTEFVPLQRFAWMTERTGMRMLGVHEMVADVKGTKSTLKVEGSGWLVALMSPLLRVAAMKAIVEENRGLKKRCEQR